MFCYYKTKSQGAGYVKRLEKLFKERNLNNPKVEKFTGQLLSNQARRVITHKDIPEDILRQIRNNAEQTNLYEVHNTQTHIYNNDDENISNTYNEDFIEINENLDSILIEFMQNLSETKETLIENRKFLPKPILSKKFFYNLNTINNILPNILRSQGTLRDINDVIYAAAKTLIEANNQKPFNRSTTIKPFKDPPWKARIKKKIDEIRKELGRLTESKNDRIGKKKQTTIKNLYNKYKIFDQQNLNNTIEILKQKVKMYAGRIKRYQDMNDRKTQNKLFRDNQHKFYRSIYSKNMNTTAIPSKQEIQDFWSKILSMPKGYNRDAQWIAEIETATGCAEGNEFQDIDLDKVKNAIKKTQNWKTPGIDKIQNFYIKYLTNTHSYMAKAFDRIFKGTEETEEWFTTGQVVLIPKNSSDTDNPRNWRPIACLPTMYKILTSIIAEELYTYCEQHKIIAVEQRGCRRGTRGCKDHLMLNKSILEDAYYAKKNLSMSWIDYQKAFDSISHDWLLKVLEIYKCPSAVKDFLKLFMSRWRVVMTARGMNSSVTTDPIQVNCGLFQGDSLSPLLFCLAINPLSQILNKYANKGYKLKDKTYINHLVYMDDLKLYAKNKNSLAALLHTTEIFTNDIGMNFGFEKCNILHMVEGRKIDNQREGQFLLSGEEFKYLQDNQNYKYLGIHESGKLNHTELRQQISKEYFKRIKKLLKTHLSARNIIKAINSYAVPLLLYSFGIVNYSHRDICYIDIKTRKLLTLNKIHKQKSEVERLYLPTEEGGRGLINIESLYKTQIIKYNKYLNSANDYLINAINEHDKNINKYSINKESKEYIKEIGLNIDENITDKNIKSAIIKKKIQVWKSKPLHNQFYKLVLEKNNIDKDLSFRWLKKQLVSPILEATVFAIQDQSIITKQFERDITKKSTDGKCRICAEKDETIQHIVSGCEKLAGKHYVQRHNNIVQYIFWLLSKKHNFETNEFWWKDSLKQPQVKENDTAKLMWEMPVQTDVTVDHNRPDIIYIDKVQNKTYLIDVAIPTDYNIGAKEIEKLTKYHLLKKEITRLWKTKAEIIPIVIGATGMVAKSIRRYCDKLDANIDITIMQKQTAIYTTTIVSKVLGDNILVDGERSEAPLP
ncbi:unnamed protein product [Euphydryas editha]|uniref:Reverse transcriptase domain-containing protein n=1 Tax=Euphydryas editha TaxID=104508 RepID=A0AAU9TZE7_EUPED|nr:unnamed protein product [Euphydryas editha]